MQDKKAYERHYCDVLSSKITGIPAGRLDHDDDPDFRIHTSTEVVGIEISRLFRGPQPNQPPPKLEEAEQHMIVQSARQIVEEAALPPLVVSVHFGAYPTLRKPDRNSLARQIAQIVIDHAPHSEAFLPLENDFSDGKYYPEKIAAIHILRAPQLTRHHWHNGRAGYVDSDFAVDLQGRIDDKNDRLASYLTQCNRCWLVIAADWDGESSFYQFSDKMTSHVFTSDFERTFFIDGFTKEVYEL